jgi:putative transposase
MESYDCQYKSSRNVVYSCKYHVIWCPKYRRAILINGVDTRLRKIILDVATPIWDPQAGKTFEGVVVATAAERVPWLRSRLPTLRTNSYSVPTVGGAPLQIIKQYVQPVFSVPGHERVQGRSRRLSSPGGLAGCGTAPASRDAGMRSSRDRRGPPRQLRTEPETERLARRRRIGVGRCQGCRSRPRGWREPWTIPRLAFRPPGLEAWGGSDPTCHKEMNQTRVCPLSGDVGKVRRLGKNL